jgi:hypothetical protein
MDKQDILRQHELSTAQSNAHETVLASKKRAKEIVDTVADKDVPTTGAALTGDLITRLGKVMGSPDVNANLVHNSGPTASAHIEDATVDISQSTGPGTHFSLAIRLGRGHTEILGTVDEERKNFFLEGYGLSFGRKQLALMFELAESVGVVEEACGIEQPFTAEDFLGQLAVGDQAGA